MNLLRKKPFGSFTVMNNVPSTLGVARNRQVVQNIINKARKKYQSATTNEQRRKIISHFKQDHQKAMKNLMNKHLKNLANLNKILATRI